MHSGPRGIPVDVLILLTLALVLRITDLEIFGGSGIQLLRTLSIDLVVRAWMPKPDRYRARFRHGSFM